MLSDGHRSSPIRSPALLSDLAPYRSPMGGHWVDGRAARREDLKRTGCRPVDPSEFQPEYRNAALEERYSKDRHP